MPGALSILARDNYLELILKRIVLRGRMLERADKNAVWEDVKEVAKVHELGVIWKWVLKDAKPKIGDAWDGL
jgi:hypothetical protein